MDSDAEFNDSLSENSSPPDPNPNPNTLNKTDNIPASSSNQLDKGNESDGLDPLFPDSNQFSAKRVLEFDGSLDGFGSQDDPDFGWENEGKKKSNDNKKRQTSVKVHDVKEKKRKKENSARIEKREKKARLVQQADFQRAMRDMKGVGFKPAPMVEKSISSVLEKIRQRKMEMSKKWASSSSTVKHEDEEDQAENDGGVERDQLKGDVKDGDEGSENDRGKDDVGVEKTTSEDRAESSDELTTNDNPLEDEVTPSFRVPINDTQDLLLDSERTNSQEDNDLNESGCPVDDVVPSAPSMNLNWDSVVDNDSSSNDEESDKENTDPHPKYLSRSSVATGDPVKDFLDEEALDDDSDDDLLHCQGLDEEDNSDTEENCDYIATDVKENPIDGEIRNQLHQQWDQQHDEAVTEKLLQKLKYGTVERGVREPSISDDEDAARTEDEEDDESDKNVPHMSTSRATTKRLKQMIPQMFTDKDDGFVSSDDEETERMLSKQCLLQKVEREKKPKISSPVTDETSKEVFGRIKKLNVLPETKKKAKTPSIFDALLNKGASSNSSKSSFLRRASSNPAPSSHKRGPSTGKSFIFGRDDSNSRSSISLPEESPDLKQKESQQKKHGSAKFTSSQAKWSTQHTEIRSETANGSSLFDILSSSAETSFDTRDDAVDQEAVFAAFKSMKKQVKIEGRSYQRP